MTISLLLVDDHQMFRDGLRAFLAQDVRFEIAGAVGTFEEAVTAVTRARAQGRGIDFVLLDIALGEGSSISGIPTLLQADPGLNILMLSMYGSPSLIRTAFDAGASGFVSKGSAGREIIVAIDAIRGGERYIDETLEGGLLRQRGNPGEPSLLERYQRLSPREQQICILLAQGCSPRKIATRLGIAKRTADAHRYHIIQKLEVQNMAELVRLVVELGLVVQGGRIPSGEDVPR